MGIINGMSLDPGAGSAFLTEGAPNQLAGLPGAGEKRLVEQPLDIELVYLTRWPEFDRLDSQSLPLAARVSALLLRKPTAKLLVAPVLHVQAIQLAPIIDEFQRQGLLSTCARRPVKIGSVPESSDIQLTEVAASIPAASSVKEAPFISRLWRKLTQQL